MVHVLLLILKIIGILLLVLLGLVLAVLLCVLFVPVRYRIQGSRHGKLQASGQVSWLLHAVSFRARYQKEELDLRLKLFGITLWPRKKKEKKKERKEPEKEDGREVLLSEPVPAPDIVDSFELPPSDQQVSSEPAPGFFHRIFIRIRRFLTGFLEKVQKIKFSILGICDKLRDIKNTAGSLLSWFQDESNQKNIRFLADCLKQVFKHIFPKKGTLRLVFGFEDPSSTGQVLAWLFWKERGM